MREESVYESDIDTEVTHRDSVSLAFEQSVEAPTLNAIVQYETADAAEMQTVEHKGAEEINATISYIDSLLKEDTDVTQEIKVKQRTYADVLNQETPEAEADRQETLDVEVVSLVTKEQQDILDELQPEARVEVCATAERAEQATSRLMQATTEEECHEAREAMTEEIMTLLELLGYDNPRETMADTLKSYDIGELRELLQHFLSSNRMSVQPGHNWMSVVSGIATRAIFIHHYESQRQREYALAA